MKVLFYSIKDYERPYILHANEAGYCIEFTDHALSPRTTEMAKGYECISVFTGDDVSGMVLEQLRHYGVKYIAIRAAGYDNIDIKKANELGIIVGNVPDYSPYAIAEHAAAMILCLNRKLVLSNEQVHRHDFTTGNLIGFDLNGKTAGIIGTGRIGSIMAKILHGFGCRLLGYDIVHDHNLESDYHLSYTNLKTLCANSDIITIHAPLNNATRQLLNRDLFRLMKTGVILINTARGPIVNTADVIEFINNGTIGYFGMDVYENEKGIFFYDHTGSKIHDKMLAQLMNMKNVLVTPHQAFATKEALTNIAKTTFFNINSWNRQATSGNELTYTPDNPAEHLNRDDKKLIELKTIL